MQMPNATHVASFRSRKRDFNRYVGKGDEEMRACLQTVRNEAKAMIEELEATMTA